MKKKIAALLAVAIPGGFIILGIYLSYRYFSKKTDESANKPEKS